MDIITGISAASRPRDRGAAGHLDPEITGGTVPPKKFFQPFGPQFGLKVRRTGPLGLVPGSATMKAIETQFATQPLNDNENALFVVHSLNKLQNRMPIIKQQILKDVGLGIVNKSQIKI